MIPLDPNAIVVEGKTTHGSPFVITARDVVEALCYAALLGHAGEKNQLLEDVKDSARVAADGFFKH